MRAIFAVGNGSEELIEEASAELLKRQIPFMSIPSEGLSSICDGRHVVGSAIDGDGDAAEAADKILLIATDLIPDISNVSEAVILLLPDASCECEYEGGGFVVASSDTVIGESVKRFPLISYGMSGKETITFSSIGENDAIICLQRRLVTLSGKVKEPQEFLWQKPSRDVLDSMPLFAALLMLDAV